MSTRSPRPEELGAFLKARRSDLTPAAVGLTSGTGTRRVRGLRREEVAQLAMISADYYARLEQGRLGGASPTVLDAIATALQLAPDERAYLFQLASKNDEQAARKPAGPECVHPQLQLLVDNLRDTPALVMGRWLDVLAWNQLATAVFRDFAAVPARRRNFLRMLFVDPQVRDRYADWHPIAHNCVGFVRATTEGIVEPRLAVLVGELSLRDADFRMWWAERHASYQTRGSKSLSHPELGHYTLDWQVLRSPDEGQTVMVMTAPPGSRGLEVLQHLAAGTAEDQAAAVEMDEAGQRGAERAEPLSRGGRRPTRQGRSD
jgi:transcriptional regulator with XRE-family HTH domain